MDETRRRQRPYFIWDYDLTEDEVRAFLRSDDPYQKAWLITRILEAAHFEDIWQYLTIQDIRDNFPYLHFRFKDIRDLWAHALELWTQPEEQKRVREEPVGYVAERKPELAPGILTPQQFDVLTRFFADEPGQPFFLTGGTALAGFYLHHRLSDDLDLFTTDTAALEMGARAVQQLGTDLGYSTKLTMSATWMKRVEIYVPNSQPLRVELVRDIDVQFGSHQVCEGIIVDSILNIAVNKVTTIFGRAAIKDLIDLYFLLQAGYTLPPLFELARQKDRGFTEFYFAGMLRNALRQPPVLPTMLKPLNVEEMLDFYRQLSDDLLRKTRPE